MDRCYRGGLITLLEWGETDRRGCFFNVRNVLRYLKDIRDLLSMGHDRGRGRYICVFGFVLLISFFETRFLHRRSLENRSESTKRPAC